jgi:hypothetical protein
MLSQSSRLTKQSSTTTFGRLGRAVRLIVVALNTIFAGQLKFEFAYDGKAILYIVR